MSNGKSMPRRRIPLKLWRTLRFCVYVVLFVGSSFSEARAIAQGYPSEASLGAAMAVIEQPYRGVQPLVIPVPWINWRSGRVHVDGTTAGYDLVHRQNYSASLVIRPRFDSVSPEDSRELSGIRSRSMSADGGISLARMFHGTLLALSAVHDILGKSHGSILSADVSRAVRFTSSSLVLLGGIDWEGRRSTAYYFGVSPSEATPLRPAYTPSSCVNLHLGFFYLRSLGWHWTGVAGVQYTNLGRSIADSPLVSSHSSAVAMIGAAYNFGR